MSLSPFHLAIPVYDVALARTFYNDVFGLEEGRSSDHWVDFDFFGHQLVIHEHPKTPGQESAHTNPVDGHNVPVPHFGVILESFFGDFGGYWPPQILPNRFWEALLNNSEF